MIPDHEPDPEIIDHIEAQVKRAHWPKVVARRLGIHPKTFDAWMVRGEKASLADVGFKPDDPEFLYRQLYERIEEAEAIAEMTLLDMAREQAELGRTTWNGFLQTLERRFTERWGRKDSSYGSLNEGIEANIKKMLAERRSDPEKPAESLRVVK